MAEFAVAATLLFTMVFFIIEFGQVTWRYNTIASLAKDAARWASVRGASGSTVADSSAVQTYVNAHSNGLTVIARTTWPDGGGNAAGKRVQVRIETSYTPQSTLIPHSLLNLHSTAQVVIAR